MKKLITLLLIVLTSCVSTKQEQPQVRNSQTTEIKVVQKVEENSKNIEKLL